MAPRIVVAVDLGTTRSAWAYKVGDSINDKIFVRIPEGASLSPSSNTKTETAALIDRHGKGELVAFGPAALERHAENAANIEGDPSGDDEEALFRWFKCALFKNKPGQTTVERVTVKSTAGHTVPLLGAMKATLSYFKDDVLGFLSSLTGRKIDAGDVSWVVTVPAIYDDFAKNFMRRAAHEAGMIDSIGSTNLRLCLEPEAACLDVIPRGDDSPLTCEAVGKKMMLVDCGGGTVDITTHSIVSVNPLNVVEVAPPTGGAWGSTQVDEAFKQWLKRFLGEWYEKVAKTETFLAIMMTWERKKAEFNGLESTEPVRLNLSVLKQQQMVGQDMEDLRTQHNHGRSRGNQVEGRGYMVILPSKLVISFFTPTLDSIAQCLRSIKRGSALRNLHRVLIVGGFSRCPMLRNVVRAELQDGTCRVLEVSEPDIAIVRGAVRYLDESTVFNSRKARLTYGVSLAIDFDDTNADHRRRRDAGKTLKYEDRDKVQIYGVFSAHIRIGDDVPTDGVTSRKDYLPASLTHDTSGVEVFASSAKYPTFVDDDSCFKLGQVSFDLDMTKKTREERGYRVEFTFGGPELTVKILHHTEEEQITDAVLTLSRVPKSYDGISGGFELS